MAENAQMPTPLELNTRLIMARYLNFWQESWENIRIRTMAQRSKLPSPGGPPVSVWKSQFGYNCLRGVLTENNLLSAESHPLLAIAVQSIVTAFVHPATVLLIRTKLNPTKDQQVLSILKAPFIISNHANDAQTLLVDVALTTGSTIIRKLIFDMSKKYCSPYFYNLVGKKFNPEVNREIYMNLILNSLLDQMSRLFTVTLLYPIETVFYRMITSGPSTLNPIEGLKTFNSTALKIWQEEGLAGLSWNIFY